MCKLTRCTQRSTTCSCRSACALCVFWCDSARGASGLRRRRWLGLKVHRLLRRSRHSGRCQSAHGGLCSTLLLHAASAPVRSTSALI